MSKEFNSLIVPRTMPFIDIEDILDKIGVNLNKNSQQASLFVETPAETEILETL